MSVECQQETHAAQQNALLFDHLGGDKQQLWRDFEVERSTAHNRIKMELHCFLWIGYEGWGPVAELVGIEGGVVSGVFNLESSGVEASDWRPRHDEQYHEA
jgi:hypothetical protein